MIIKIIQSIQYIIFSITDFFIFPTNSYQEKTILLIRLDAIGDYILFRNFIEELKKDEKYKDYKITLLGNSVWKSIAEELDSEYVDEFIWLDRQKFTRNIFYRFDNLKKISEIGYEIIISPVYSRELIVADSIVKKVFANEKIGSVGDLSNMQKWQKNIADKYYTKLIPAKNEILFEFYRNKEFFENFLQKKINIKKPIINLKKETQKVVKSLNEYAVLFIGASTKFHKWDVEKFAEVGEFLRQKYSYNIVLCGAPSDIGDAIKFSKYFHSEYIDLVGKTSLVDLMYVIRDAQMILSNETSGPHFAAAFDVKNIFVLYNGNHYGRFTPYPKEINSNYYMINHPKIEKDINKYEYLSNTYGYGSKLNIDEIEVNAVVDRIEEVLSE